MLSKFQVLEFLSYKISPTPSVLESYVSEDIVNGARGERKRQVGRVGYECWGCGLEVSQGKNSKNLQISKSFLLPNLQWIMGTASHGRIQDLWKFPKC